MKRFDYIGNQGEDPDKVELYPLYDHATERR